MDDEVEMGGIDGDVQWVVRDGAREAEARGLWNLWRPQVKAGRLGASLLQQLQRHPSRPRF
ncbi:MAG: hypothetical protein INR71_14465 [Terriglobus roseus]|nr:hypothetical protein [Terriglobus roseus]